MTNLRSLPLCVLACAFLAAVSVPSATYAQQTAPNIRIAGPIDESQMVTLRGNVLPAANSGNDRGTVSASMPMQDLVLVLSRSPERQAAFDAYVESEYDSSSPNFHQWLTADQIGNQFGPSLTDIATITNWLTSQGFTVTHTAKDRTSITFSGTAGQVQSAFRTSIHNLSVHGVDHIANMSDPQIPAALAPVVVGIKQLHDFHPRPLHRVGSVVQYNSSVGKWQRSSSPATIPASISPLATSGIASTETATPRPQFYTTSGGFVEDDVSPSDFATIYNVQPLWTAGTTGTSQTIAIVGTSDICIGQTAAPCSSANDVSSYKSSFGLSAGHAPIIKVATGSTDPGVCTSTTSTTCGIGDLEENTLDVEVSGAVAPAAQVVLVTSASTGSNDPIFQDAQYIEENINTASEPVYGAHQMSVSYGLCELFEGTSGNVTYYNLWQSAAAEGLAVFVASGDSGSPACDQGQDSYGNPYSAQGGLTVSGIASTPFNTAVGGTDFSWCQPTIIQTGTNKGNVTGCGSTNASPYWNASNTSNNSSAKGYVPEIPWNDTCENPIWGAYLESIATLVGVSGGSSPEQACNFVQNYWYQLYQGGNPVLAGLVDTVGGGGGQSNCVVNSTDTSNNPTCTTSATSVSTGSTSVTLSHDGWPVPSWQTGVTGTSSLTSRAIPDVSFFSGDGALDSATLICLAAAGGTCTSSTVATTALEIGGTSVASPEMAGVMALINQKWGNQGLPNKPFYQLGAKQTYSSCSAESVTTSSSCYFQSIDQGNNAMPCSLGATDGEGGAIYAGSGNWNVNLAGEYTGDVSPNCTAISSGDVIGTLVSSGTTPGYNATAGFNMATGLGSLNVANVVNNASVWVPLGTTASTVTVTPASFSITPNQSLLVTVTVAGASGTPTGTVTLSGGGYTSAAATLSTGKATITIPASSFSGTGNPFTVTLTASYSGDTTYAQAAGTSATITVTKLTPTAVTVTPATGSTNSNVPLNVTVTVTGTGGTPTGTVTLSGGGYSSATQTLSSGSYTFTIPANTFTTTNTVTLAANYSGDNTYVSDSGSASVAVTYIQVMLPTVTVTPSPATINSSQSVAVTVSVTGTNGTATGQISLAGGGYNSAALTIGTSPCTSATSCVFTIPANSFTSFGSVTLTAHYLGDSDYLPNTGTGTVTVNQSVYALAATAPTAVNPGGSASSTVSLTSSTGYTGSVALTCSLTTSPAGVTFAPTCSIGSGSPIAVSNGTPGGTASVSITTTAATSAMLDRKPGGKAWLGAGGGAVLAFLVFLGIPARRRSWRALLGMVMLLAAVGSLSACGGGGGGGGGGTSNPGTTPGSYTFTVKGVGSDSSATTESTTFNLTVN